MGPSGSDGRYIPKGSNYRTTTPHENHDQNKGSGHRTISLAHKALSTQANPDDKPGRSKTCPTNGVHTAVKTAEQKAMKTLWGSAGFP